MCTDTKQVPSEAIVVLDLIWVRRFGPGVEKPAGYREDAVSDMVLAVVLAKLKSGIRLEPQDSRQVHHNAADSSELARCVCVQIQHCY